MTAGSCVRIGEADSAHSRTGREIKPEKGPDLVPSANAGDPSKAAWVVGCVWVVFQDHDSDSRAEDCGAGS